MSGLLRGRTFSPTEVQYRHASSRIAHRYHIGNAPHPPTRTATLKSSSSTSCEPDVKTDICCTSYCNCPPILLLVSCTSYCNCPTMLLLVPTARTAVARTFLLPSSGRKSYRSTAIALLHVPGSSSPFALAHVPPSYRTAAIAFVHVPGSPSPPCPLAL